MTRTAIIGCGVSGSYLYRMLSRYRPDIQVDIYAIPVNTQCKIRPCGWIVSYPEFKKLGDGPGMDFEQFVMGRFSEIEIDGKRIPAENAVINKPLMIEKLLGDTSLIYDTPDVSKYDRIIDATGKRTYFLPRPNDEYVTIYQMRALDNSQSYPRLNVHWDRYCKDMLYLIPLGDGTLHIGHGSLITSEMSKNEIARYISGKKIVCSCVSTLWFGGPNFPLVRDKFIAIGESAGTVDPLSGMGITPAMDTARTLVEHWDNPLEYQRRIKHKYAFMARLKRARDGEISLMRLFNIAISVSKEYSLVGFRPGIYTTFKKLTA